MANVKFSRKEFEKEAGKIDEKMKEKIALFGTPVESVTDDEIEIEIFPNRPDLYSLHGYLRSFLSFLGKKASLKKYKINKPEEDYEVKIDRSVEDVRPYTACAIVKNLKFDDEKIKEIIGIQEKIHSTLGRNRKKIAIGIYPLEKIKLPIRYEAREPNKIRFIPLESNKELTGIQILRQHPTGREYAPLLSGKKKYPVFVDSNNEILSMPPIINSEKTGKISENTKEIFIECSGFDFNILKKTLNILATTLSDMGGKIFQMKLKYRKTEITPDLNPEKMKISAENCNKLLGLQLSEKKISRLLLKMGHNYSLKNKEVEIPSYRTDILHPADIYEDIAIAYGYDKFEPEIPQIFTIGRENKKEVIKGKISEILTGLNLLEISGYHLATKSELKKAKLKLEIEVEKSKTDYRYLRQNLLCSVFKVLGENLDAEYPQKIFEIGKVFSKDDRQETGIKEADKLAIALASGNFTELRQILEYLAKMLNIQMQIKEADKSGFIEGRTGKIVFREKEIGFLGEVHPTLLNSWHLKMPLAFLEIDLEEILDFIILQMS